MAARPKTCWSKRAASIGRGARPRAYSNADMRFAYRHCGAPDDLIFTQALFAGERGDRRRHRRRDGTRSPRSAKRRSRSRAAPAARPSKIRRATRRGSSSTPPAAAGLRLGDAQVSEMHCQFLDQSRQRHRRRYRDARRNGARAREDRFRRRSRMGDQADRRTGRGVGRAARRRPSPPPCRNTRPFANCGFYW